MSAKSEWTTIEGKIPAVVARPAQFDPPWPGLIIIHSVIGVDSYMRELAESFSALGYFAILPDIYADDPGYKLHQQEHIEIAAHMGIDPPRQAEVLSHLPADALDAVRNAREWINGRPTDTYIHTVVSAFEHLRAHPDIREIGAFGFCMGGRLVGELAATGANLSAGVIHYGSPPKLDLVPNIKAHLEGHYASTDGHITGKVPAFAEAMTSAGKDFTYYIYEADHGFSLNDRFPAAKKTAMSRSSAFLNRHLRPHMAAGAEQ